jgi:hypothetical protein
LPNACRKKVGCLLVGTLFLGHLLNKIAAKPARSVSPFIAVGKGLH